MGGGGGVVSYAPCIWQRDILTLGSITLLSMYTHFPQNAEAVSAPVYAF